MHQSSTKAYDTWNKQILQCGCDFGGKRLAKTKRQIFQDALNKLQVQACEAVYIGDSPIEDIKGAKQAGLKTVFVPSQFNSLDALSESQQKPDYTAKDLKGISEKLNSLISSLKTPNSNAKAKKQRRTSPA